MMVKTMTIDIEKLLALPAAEKLRVIEILWDSLGDAASPIPLPEWIEQEAKRRMDEMHRDPTFRLSHEEVWRQIDRWNQ